MSLFSDFGFLDVINSLFFGRRRDYLIGNESFEKFSSIEDVTLPVWCVFLPWRTDIKTAEKYKFLPKNYVAYQGPASIVHPDPNKSREALFHIEKDFQDTVLNKYKSVNILAFSASQYQAVRIANRFPVGKLVLVSPGSQMGKALWESIGTREVKRQSMKLGYKTADQYDNILAETNPIEETTNLPKDIEIHLATHDKYVPYKYAKIFVDRLVERGYKPKVIVHKNKGHVATMIEFGANKSI